MKRKFYKKTAIAICAIFLGFGPFAAGSALAFNPNFLISDFEFTDRFSLSIGRVHDVLKRGPLATFTTMDVDGRIRHAADIIWRAGQRNGISPKVILTMLQKEQSLIEDTTPKASQFDWAMGYGICDNCNHDTPEAQRFKGFAKQINSATLQLTEGYLADLATIGQTVAGFATGKRSTVDGTYVTPANDATAALYTYTPHLHGNENFVKIYHRYFSQRYPTGTLLQDNESGGIFLIQFGRKRPILSKAALMSRYNPDHVIPVSSTALSGYESGLSIAFPNYALLMVDDITYLLVDDILRPFDSEETKRALGFVPDEELEVEQLDIAGYEIGNPITQNTEHASGALFKLQETGSYFYVEDGVRHPVASRSIVTNAFADRRVEIVSIPVVEAFRPGNAAKLRDGSLVTTADDPTVYIITEGTRRAIPDENTFLTLGFSWSNVETINEAALNVHPENIPFTIDNEEDDSLSTANN